MLTATCLTNVVARESAELAGGNFGNVKFKRKDKVITLASVNNSAKIGKEKITVDPLTLFHRICVAKQSDEDLKMFFTFELSPSPLSLFNEEGMRKGTKSSLFSAFTPTKIDAVQGVFNAYSSHCGQHSQEFQDDRNRSTVPRRLNSSRRFEHGVFIVSQQARAVTHGIIWKIRISSSYRISRKFLDHLRSMFVSPVRGFGMECPTAFFTERTS
ncbi:hypothetical protein AVEN_149938-1 [Araneus ventricosus]|uniref:Uncharacterized protein n=1 Tax=Araneus ventricosus TaxID=182803 RepID=A0A4Y2LZJ0_ARAVE|nr:hypothetical protein AVEN_149938-1 [Araneus ventricosus]